MTFPLFFKGSVEKGFQRGSKELGTPTANIPTGPYADILESLPAAVYYGYASVPKLDNDVIHKAAVSIGWNPFYKNKRKTIEVYIIHDYGRDFYNEEIRCVLLGFIRKEADFSSLDSLITAIQDDVTYAENQLDLPAHAKDHYHKWLTAELQATL